jgi:hypothetical protein
MPFCIGFLVHKITEKGRKLSSKNLKRSHGGLGIASGATPVEVPHRSHCRSPRAVMPGRASCVERLRGVYLRAEPPCQRDRSLYTPSSSHLRSLPLATPGLCVRMRILGRSAALARGSLPSD